MMNKTEPEKEWFGKYLTLFIDERDDYFAIKALISMDCPLSMIDRLSHDLGADYCVQEHCLILFEVLDTSFSSKGDKQ